MAKIDISSIEGYAEMSAEEKLEALEAFELPEPDYSGYVKKELLDKASSEAANFKKQLREKMTEEEAAKAKAPSAHQGKCRHGRRMTAGHSSVTKKTLKGELTVNDRIQHRFHYLRDKPG